MKSNLMLMAAAFTAIGLAHAGRGVAIDLSPGGDVIDAGATSFALAGYFGGYANSDDNTPLTVVFIDGAGQSRSRQSMLQPTEAGCKVDSSNVTPSNGDVVQRCTTKDGHTMTTHVSYSVSNSTGYEGVMEYSTDDGKHKVKMKSTGKWLAAACGDVP